MIRSVPLIIASSLSAALILGDTTRAHGQLRPPESAPKAQVRALGDAAADGSDGVFELVSSKGHYMCRLTLRMGSEADKTRVAILPSCRKAFPVVAKAADWRLSDAGTVQLMSARGEAVIEFKEKEAKLVSEIKDGTVFELKPADADWFRRQRAAARQRAAPVAGSPAQAAVIGVYEVSRSAQKPASCQITLSNLPAKTQPNAPSSSAGQKAALVDGCQDRGMQIFSPDAWRIDNGKLVLIARKGHELVLIPGQAGAWRKEKTSGEPLELQRK